MNIKILISMYKYESRNKQRRNGRYRRQASAS